MTKENTGVAQATVAKDKKEERVGIAPPNFNVAKFEICGLVPYVQHAFSGKAREIMRQKQEAGSVAKKGQKREAKDFDSCYEQAKHISTKGWAGIPATAFRCALISACRLVDFKMTRAKLSLFVVEDGYDKVDGTGLVKITKGEPHHVEHSVRLESGVVDIRPRPMWDAGWEATVTIRWDADQFAIKDVANLLLRAGMQVGIGEGRPDSKDSAGMGWGLFQLKEEKE